VPSCRRERNTQKEDKGTHGKNAPQKDFTPILRRICGVDLAQVPGLNLFKRADAAGRNWPRYEPLRSAQAFGSWLGLLSWLKNQRRKGAQPPDSQSHQPRRHHSAPRGGGGGAKDTWIGVFYRRMKARKGGPKAVTATARKLACILYHLLKYQEEFVALDMEKYAANAQAHRFVTCSVKPKSWEWNSLKRNRSHRSYLEELLIPRTLHLQRFVA